MAVSQYKQDFSALYGPKELVQPVKNIKIKLCIQTNSYMLNLMVMFTHSDLDRKHPSWANLVQNIKIDCLRRNLPSFQFRPKTCILGKFDPKYQSCLFKMKLSIQTNSYMLNSMVMFTFSALNQNTLSGQIWSKKSKFSTNMKLGFQLINIY